MTRVGAVSDAKNWLASVIKGAPPRWPVEGVDATMLLEEAQKEDVVVLVQWNLQQAGESIPADLLAAFSSAARNATLLSMLLQAEACAILKALKASSIPGLLLKGSALAYWAYPQPQARACSDVDLLVPSREAAELLAGELQRQGYLRSETSGQLVAYELMCRREAAPGFQVEIDVHWRLVNSVLFAEAFSFDELMAASIALPLLGPNARGLGPIHACIHACVHRALNLSIGISDRLKWLYDIDVLTQRFNANEWDRLVEVARTRGLAGVVLSGLNASADAFGRALPADAVTALRQAYDTESLDMDRLSDWQYMQRMTFNALPGSRQRLQWVWQRIFPSKAYLAILYSAPTASYAFLMWLRVRGLLVRLMRRAGDTPG